VRIQVQVCCPSPCPFLLFFVFPSFLLSVNPFACPYILFCFHEIKSLNIIFLFMSNIYAVNNGWLSFCLAPFKSME
jgi:hypothetical protein